MEQSLRLVRHRGSVLGVCVYEENEMKPDWKNAPGWAKWLAMDASGYWHWLEYEPEWDEAEGEWMLTSDMSIEDEGLCSPASNKPDCDGPDWGLAWDTLENKP